MALWPSVGVAAGAGFAVAGVFYKMSGFPDVWEAGSLTIPFALHRHPP